MRVSRAFNKRTRRGKVMRVVREHYVRDDIACGAGPCKVCDHSDDHTPVLLSERPHRGRYLVIDTNVALHQMDLLESSCPALCDVVVCQTVVEEVRHRNLAVYRRLHSLLRDHSRRFVLFANEHHRQTYAHTHKGESPNDRNDRAIRIVAAWYEHHLSTTQVPDATGKATAAPQVLLITNDIGNRDKARAGGQQAMTTREFVRSLSKEFPGLEEVLAATEADDAAASAAGAGADEDVEGRTRVFRARRRAQVYTPHLPMSAVLAGIKRKVMFRGTLRVNRDCWFEAKVGVPGLDPDAPGELVNVLIKGHQHINRATEGDIVAIQLLPKSEWRAPSSSLAPTVGVDAVEAEAGEDMPKVADGDGAGVGAGAGAGAGKDGAVDTGGAASGAQPTAKVVGIIKRNWRSYCGTTEDDGGVSTGSVLVRAVDERLPLIRIRTRQQEALVGKRIVVTIDKWDATSRYPDGHYVRTLGDVGDKEVETQVVLLEHDIPAREFSAAVMACLPPADWRITAENSRGRTDRRHLCVMSIDPPGCKDIDDALHVRRLPNGNFEVGVHIADVTYFVHHGTAIDVEAADRSNTTYLVERRLDMLPGLLTETLCSLKGNVDRFAFSAIFEMTPDAEIVAEEFGRSIIHSKAAMTYGQAQALLSDPTATGEIAQGVKDLAVIARILRKRRIAAGALTLASPEVRFELDSETHDPLDVAAYKIVETNHLVEEFMLLANCRVAARITKAFPMFACLRRHPPPSRRQFDGLMAAASAVGVTLDVSSSKALADSLDAAVIEDKPHFNKLLRILTTRCMTQAVYFGSGEVQPSEYLHYGLAAPIYTHFTSPIRRYADVIVHRLLGAAVGIAPLPKAYEDKSGMRALCDNMNRRHLMSQLAGRASVALHTGIFFKGRVVEELGLVMRLRRNGFVVLVPRFGIEGNIFLVDKDTKRGGTTAEDLFDYDATAQTLTRKGQPTQRLRVFDEVRVSIEVEELRNHTQRLVYRLVSPFEAPVPKGARTVLAASSTANTEDGGAPSADDGDVEMKGDDGEGVRPGAGAGAGSGSGARRGRVVPAAAAKSRAASGTKLKRKAAAKVGGDTKRAAEPKSSKGKAAKSPTRKTKRRRKR